MRRLRAYLKDECGSEVVTFVIVIPLFMMIFALMLTFSQIIYAGTVSLNAANAGCRQAIIQESRGAAQAKADGAARGYVEGAGMGVSYVTGGLANSGAWGRGNLCSYTVQVKVSTIMPMGGSFDNSYLVSRSCTMMIEREKGSA